MLSGLSRRRPWLVLGIAMLIAVGAGLGVRRLVDEEDVLVFLPASDPDVTLFRDVSKRFGSLKVALIGVEVVDEKKDVFHPDVLRRIERVSRALRDTQGIDRVVSLTTLPDIVAGEAGAEITQLIAELPKSADEEGALRKKVLARDHVVGNYVSADGRAALVMVFLAEGVAARSLVARIRAIASEGLDPDRVYFGGAPFAGDVIYGEAQSDVRRLSPIALLVLFLVVLLSFREPVGIALTLGVVAWSTGIVMGAMGWLGVHFTVASATMPVILFASGSSYAVHVLGRYYLERRTHDAELALARAVQIVAPPLAIAAATTAVGFLSFVVTDVRPMRAFGIACGAGVGLCWLGALTIVPAVLALWPRPARETARLEWMGEQLVRLWDFSARHRRAIKILAFVLLAASIVPMTRVEVHMEPSAFFRVGSEPWKAERFLETRFGGAHFVQVEADGDFNEPATLRELARLGDFARSLEGVSQVSSIVDPLRIVSDAMGGQKRLPSTRAQVSNLYFFLEGEAGISSLLDETRARALMHIRIRGAAPSIVEALERYAKERSAKHPIAPTRQDVSTRIAWFAQAVGAKPSRDAIERTARVVSLPGDGDLELVSRTREIAARNLSDAGAPKWTVEDTIAALSGTRKVDDEDSVLWLDGVKADRERERRRLGVERATPLLARAAGMPAEEAKTLARLAPIVDDLFVEDVAGAERAVRFRVAGEPVLDRGFSRSVGHSQERSLVVSIAVVLALLLGLFRSLRVALICGFPALLTLALLFATMALSGIHIDLGTSMVAGIATGAGADFAMHYLWYLRSERAEDVTRTVGPVMVVGVLIVGLGFWVLALGKSPVMQLFGALTGGAMILSAILTCLLIPAFMNRVSR